MSQDDFARQAAVLLRQHHGALFADITTTPTTSQNLTEPSVLDVARSRIERIRHRTVEIIERNSEPAARAALMIANWMEQRAVVRVVALGSTRIAATIPARRLNDGGARVYLHDDFLPMPNSLHCGGLIIVAIGNQFRMVAALLQQIRAKNRDIDIFGITTAGEDAISEACDIFIDLPSSQNSPSADLSYADIEEQSIVHVLDALVIHAGDTLGYTETRWQLGHDDLTTIYPDIER